MKVVFNPVIQLADYVWSVLILPEEAELLAGEPIRHGIRSVILANEAHFDGDSEALTAEIGDLNVLSIGDGKFAVVVLSPSS